MKYTSLPGVAICQKMVFYAAIVIFNAECNCNFLISDQQTTAVIHSDTQKNQQQLTLHRNQVSSNPIEHSSNPIEHSSNTRGTAWRQKHRKLKWLIILEQWYDSQRSPPCCSKWSTAYLISHLRSSYVGMKTEQKYSELTVFVFYIMNRFLTWKIISFNWFHNHFQPFFVLFNC
jgi:hypothetical protein